jgi:hypothetical protein
LRNQVSDLSFLGGQRYAMYSSSQNIDQVVYVVVNFDRSTRVSFRLIFVK